MKLHGKKLVAPIIITVLIALYYIGFAAVCVFVREIPLSVQLLGGIVPLIFAGIAVAMLVERIKEIRSGEEDDLGQY